MINAPNLAAITNADMFSETFAELKPGFVGIRSRGIQSVTNTIRT